MTRAYKVNEIFYSLQGEGANAGTPAVFIRFAGCNLRCPFCDTAHEAAETMTEADIIAAVIQWDASLVVLTGGEPTLQATPHLIDALHEVGRTVAIETNGTRPVPAGCDWVTLSPKADVCPGAAPVLTECDELKIVFQGEAIPAYADIRAKYRFLQPCDTGDAGRNAALQDAAVRYCLAHPQWRLSVQLHKILNIQ